MEASASGGHIALSAVALLLPPTLYAIGSAPLGYGPPFMVLQLMGPGSNHSAVGLLLLFVCRIACPLATLGLGCWLWRQERPILSITLILAAVVLLALAFAMRQPYGIVHPSRATLERVGASKPPPG